MFRRILKNPNYYGLESNSVEHIKEFLHKLVARIFKNLKDSNCIELLHDEAKTVMPTELGFISASYYLRHQTVRKFQQSIQPRMTFKEMLRLLSDAE